MSDTIQQEINRERHNFRNMQDAQEFADKLWVRHNVKYMPIDNGPYHSPQFSVIVQPQVGDFVSYAFNGDYYPDSEIVRISKTMKRITTASGKQYYRRKQTGSWKLNRTWTMVKGHHNERNPSF